MIANPHASAPIFVGGAGRSGSTLLRVLLDSHPSIACGPELKVLPLVGELWWNLRQPLYPVLRRYHLESEDIDRSFATLIEGLLARQREKSGKPRIAEKTPDNIFFFRHLARIFPRSPLVHIVRDGRDVVASLLRMEWYDAVTGERDRRTSDPAEAARYWVSAVRAGRDAARHCPLYFEVRYEELVTRPEATLGRLFAFLGEELSSEVLEFHRVERDLTGESSADRVRQPIDTRSIGRYRDQLSADELRVVQEIAGEELRSLGYAGEPAA